MLFVGCKIKTGPAQTGCKTTPRQGAARVWTHGINKQRAGPAGRPTRTRPGAAGPRNATSHAGDAPSGSGKTRPHTRPTAPATWGRQPRSPHRARAAPTDGQKACGRRKAQGPTHCGGRNEGSGGHPPRPPRHMKPRPRTAHGHGGDGAGCRQGASTASRAKGRHGARTAPVGDCSSFRSDGKDSANGRNRQGLDGGNSPSRARMRPFRMDMRRKARSQEREQPPPHRLGRAAAGPSERPGTRRASAAATGKSVTARGLTDAATEKSRDGLAFLPDFGFLCSRRRKAPRSETKLNLNKL